MKKIVIRLGLVAASVGMSMGGILLQACGDDDVTATTPDAAADGTAVTPQDGAPGPGPGDSGAADAGEDAGKVVQFTVPAGGGSVDFDGATTKFTLAFPASAGGKTITMQAAKSESLGWAAGTFTDVVKLGPDGTRFTDPVIVKTANKTPVIMSYPDTATTKGPPAPLLLNAAKDGFELRHFSWLVIPGKLCDSQGYNEVPADPQCASAGANTTRRTLACKGYSFCLNFQIGCCVVPGTDAGQGCDLATVANPVSWSMSVTDSNGGQYPYCDVDAGPETAPSCGGGSPFYSFEGDGGCRVARDCTSQFFMQCADGLCACYEGNAPTSIDGGTFAQTDTCDTAATMKRDFVQKCHYPTK